MSLNRHFCFAVSRATIIFKSTQNLDIAWNPKNTKCESTHKVLLHVLPYETFSHPDGYKRPLVTKSCNHQKCVHNAAIGDVITYWGINQSSLANCITCCFFWFQEKNCNILCYSDSMRSWLSAALVKRRKLVGTSVFITTKELNSATGLKSHLKRF